jgi:predicted acetyltransferase
MGDAPAMTVRPFDARRDLSQLQRIWHEVGWTRTPDDDHVGDFLSVGSCLTAVVDDAAECAVHTLPGLMRYQNTDLQLCIVAAVTTGRVARKRGFAQRLTALQLADAARGGAEVAALGMFDQGFYDRLGFATGSYQHLLRFDPSALTVTDDCRPPARLGVQHWALMHDAMVHRYRTHGGCVLHHPQQLKAELAWTNDGFGLGYFEGDRLTHFFWAEAGGEYGPYRIVYMAYQNRSQLFELLALLKSLGDQVSSVSVLEPPGTQLQMLLRQPLRMRRATRRGQFENAHFSGCAWQLRVLDVPGCVRHRRWRGPPFEFGLQLADPLEQQLAGHWRGVGGAYRVRVGAPCQAMPGAAAQLPQLQTSVGGFTRLWFGVLPATHLAMMGELEAPLPLLEQLDDALQLPRLQTGWDF